MTARGIIEDPLDVLERRIQEDFPTPDDEFARGQRAALLAVLRMIEDERRRLQEIADEHVPGRVY